jgi:hypothetical protein
MIIQVQFRCDKVVHKEREQEWEDDKDLSPMIGVVCFNHAILLVNKGYKVRAEVGDQADECPLCNHPELYLQDLPELSVPSDPVLEKLLELQRKDPEWFSNLPSLLTSPVMKSREELLQEFRTLGAIDSRMQEQISHIKNPPQEDILGYDLDDLGWWKCRSCGKTYHPSKFQEHIKDCVPVSTDTDPNSSDHESSNIPPSYDSNSHNSVPSKPLKNSNSYR